MTRTEQAFLTGFTKRAAQFGIHPEDAVKLAAGLNLDGKVPPVSIEGAAVPRRDAGLVGNSDLSNEAATRNGNNTGILNWKNKPFGSTPNNELPAGSGTLPHQSSTLNSPGNFGIGSVATSTPAVGASATGLPTSRAIALGNPVTSSFDSNSRPVGGTPSVASTQTPAPLTPEVKDRLLHTPAVEGTAPAASVASNQPGGWWSEAQKHFSGGTEINSDSRQLAQQAFNSHLPGEALRLGVGSGSMVAGAGQ